MSLVTLEAMKTYLGVSGTDFDAFLTEQIALFSSAIENYCCRKFTQTSYTQTFYKSDFVREDDSHALPMFHYPIISVASVKEVCGENESPLIASDYRINGQLGFIYRFISGMKSRWFLRLGYDATVVVAYSAGYATIPPEIQAVVKSLVEERYNKKKSGIELNFGSDVQRVSIPGVISIDFDYTLQSNERATKFGTLLGNYVNVLDYFRTERALIGSIKENNYVV